MFINRMSSQLNNVQLVAGLPHSDMQIICHSSVVQGTISTQTIREVCYYYYLVIIS